MTSRFYRSIFVACAITCLAIGQPGRRLPATQTTKALAAPHLSQTDPEGGFSGGGDMFCAPTAASNALVLLARAEYPKLLPRGNSEHDRALELIRQLAAPDFMGTNEESGTGPAEVLRGLEKYVQASGYQFASVLYEGWRYVPRNLKGDVFDTQPNLQMIQQYVADPRGLALLNVGYYVRTPEGSLRRTGGHWITALGYGTDGLSADSRILLVHNPASSNSSGLIGDVVRLKVLAEVQLTGKTKNLPQSGRGYFSVEGPGFPKGRKWDVAVIDCTVLMSLKPATH